MVKQRHNKGRKTLNKQYFEFEQDVIESISKYMPNLSWVGTKQTRDGNKDAISELKNAVTGKSMQAWLEVKFRHNTASSISSRAFDSTLVSASQEDNIAALFFATNAKTSQSLHFRIHSFCNRSIPNLQGFRLFDNESLDVFGTSEKTETNRLLKNLIINEPVVVNCIDYSNHKLSDETAVYLEEVYYVVFPVFLTTNSENINCDVGLHHNADLVGRYKLIDAWNFLAFRAIFVKSDFKDEKLTFEMRFRDERRIIRKKMKHLISKNRSIFYQDGLVAAERVSSDYKMIANREQRGVVVLVEGTAATGKTTLAESICSEWSATHEIFNIQIIGTDSIDSKRIYDLAKFIFDVVNIEEISDEENLKPNYVDNKKFIKNLIENHIGSTRRKTIIVDDFHKASGQVGSQLIDLFFKAFSFRENISLFIFSRPCKASVRAEEKLPLTSKLELRGPTRSDIRSTFENLLLRSINDEEVNILFRLCPNLINLNQVFSVIEQERNVSKLHEIFAEYDANSLLKLPKLSKLELDALYLVYSIPNGLEINDVGLLNLKQDAIDGLLNNRLIKMGAGRYKPVHDLWREVILKDYQLITENVLDSLRLLSEENEDMKLTYLATRIKLAESFNDNYFQDARAKREELIEGSQFGRALFLTEAIASSKLHTESETTLLEDASIIKLIIRDYIRAGEVLNHCGYNNIARKYFEKALKASSDFMHDIDIEDLALWSESEIYNLDYWAFDCSFLKSDPMKILSNDSSKDSLLRKITQTAILNRSMMALYLLDQTKEARSVFNQTCAFCDDEKLLDQKAHLLMDSGKNEMIFSMEKAITLYSAAIKIYESNNVEYRRILIAKTQRESLKVKLGSGDSRTLSGYISNLEESMLYQEHMNSMIDLATIFAFGKNNKASLSCLNQVNSHPDYASRRRQRYKVAQCKALIELNDGNPKSAMLLLKEAQVDLKGVGDSYHDAINHNLSIKDPKHYAWFQSNLEMKRDIIYVDPRLW